MNKEQFIKEIENLGLKIDSDKLQKLDIYYHLLKEENQKYNLTNITDESEVYLKHFYDSLTIVKSIKLDNQYLCDIGTGAGFPGMVIKIFFPKLHVDLIDATQKKCNFLSMVIEKLKLENISVINARAEEYSKENRERYDIITSRAVAPLKHLLEYSIPLLKINGNFIALKSNIDPECQNVENYHNKLFLKDEEIIKFTLPYENSQRSIYKVTKYKTTPLIYPRMYSQIKKKDI